MREAMPSKRRGRKCAWSKKYSSVLRGAVASGSAVAAASWPSSSPTPGAAAAPSDPALTAPSGWASSAGLGASAGGGGSGWQQSTQKPEVRASTCRCTCGSAGFALLATPACPASSAWPSSFAGPASLAAPASPAGSAASALPASSGPSWPVLAASLAFFAASLFAFNSASFLAFSLATSFSSWYTAAASLRQRRVSMSLSLPFSSRMRPIGTVGAVTTSIPGGVVGGGVRRQRSVTVCLATEYI
mmetsp:Transcript_78042/g.240924  ORF Transcript_78042/g.240924 Transcript_78042/m.240924 type:complete len:245 (-) Transcript_78042:514-1248(-)